MAKITGIGGVFFKASNPTALIEWYKTNLGLNPETWGGAILKWPNDVAEDKGLTVWSTAPNDTKWFEPSTNSFMINYRIDSMTEMIKQLTTGNVEIIKGPEYHENGAFLWILDLEGNKVELWEPKLWDDANKK